MKKIQIQIDVSPRGSAPQAPTDFNTLLPVALWRGEPVDIAVALYADIPGGTPADMTGTTEMKLDFSGDADHTATVATSTATVANTRLDLSALDDADWLAGAAQHALFPLAKGALAPDMTGQTQIALWLRVTMLKSSEWIVLCNGQITCHEAGAWPV